MNSTILQTKELVYDKCGFQISNLIIEKESNDYCACQFEVNNRKIIFRKAKITPKKIGQFVVFWKRKSKDKPIEPFHVADEFDLFVINVKTETRFGQFVFPKSVLLKQKIISNIHEGKRAFRVYPPWDVTENKQALKTQQWQLNSFLEISKAEKADIDNTKKLYLNR